ncbi:MAG: hypothetical protein Q9220_003233 [cf. Caloplaca sp. 1 TL-2023]
MHEDTTSSQVPSQSSKRKRANNGVAMPDKDCREKSQEGKRRRLKGYTSPSSYDHLPPLPDTIIPNLLCLFVGLNPGIQTATKGHPYAHPTNHYWPLLHTSGLTPDRRLAPSEYTSLPETYALGNTNIVSRATRDGSELSKAEMVLGAAVLDEKVRRWKPEVVCLVGKSIWEAVWKWKHGRGIKKEEFRYGFQDEAQNMGREKGGNRFFDGVKGVSNIEGDEGDERQEWDGARVFVATSTSGLAANLTMKEKEDIWAKLGGWVEKRRQKRKQVTAKDTSESVEDHGSP